MNDADREAFLAEANIAVLSTVDSKNRPHATPVWYLYENGDIRISVGRNSQKHRNIEGNPNVSFVVDSRGLPPFAVMIQGTAEIGPPFSDEEGLRLAVRYLGEDVGRRYHESTAGNESISLRIKPRKTAIFDPRMGA